MKRYPVLVLVLWLLVGCGAEHTRTPDLAAAQTAQEKAAHTTMTAGAPTPTDPPTHTPTVTLTAVPTNTATGRPTNTPTHTPTVTPTNTPTHTPTVTPTNTPTHTPTPTPLPSLTPTPTPTPAPYVELPAEQILLCFPCEPCTTLRWDVENVKAIYLNGEGVVGHDSLEVCLEEDYYDLETCYYQYIEDSYLFRVVTEGGDIERSVSVIYLNPECQAYLGTHDWKLNRGECTTLHWSIDYWDYFRAVVNALYLNGQQVPHEGTQEVCPIASQTYTLRLATRCGDIDYQVTIEVKP